MCEFSIWGSGVKNCVIRTSEVRRKKNEKNLSCTIHLNFSTKSDFFLSLMKWAEFLYSIRAFCISCPGQISPLFLTANPQFLLIPSQMGWFPHSPLPILKCLAEKRSVKTGYLYFYWFLQTMTTFPERQCQETINVCEKEVKVLWA